MSKLIGRVLRFVASIVLLAYVWTNSHWSVALSITLIGFDVELLSVALEHITEILHLLKQRLP